MRTCLSFFLSLGLAAGCGSDSNSSNRPNDRDDAGRGSNDAGVPNDDAGPDDDRGTDEPDDDSDDDVPDDDSDDDVPDDDTSDDDTSDDDTSDDVDPRDSGAPSGDSGTPDDPSLPEVTVQPSDNYRRLAASDGTSVVIDEMGRLHAFGTNNQGGLGQGDPTVRTLSNAASALAPTTIVGAGQSETFVHVVGGRHHFLALTSEGDLYGWGDNEDDQLDDSEADVFEPTLLMADIRSMDTSGNRSVALDNDSGVWIWGRDIGPDPVLVAPPDGVEFVSIARGEGHLLALSRDGLVYGWGNNASGEVGNAGEPRSIAEPTLLLAADGQTPLAGIVAIAAGDYFSLALDWNGTVWAWGRNPQGNLGDGTQTQRTLPVPVGGEQPIEEIVSIFADHEQAYAIDTDGMVWGWGRNGEGQLGGATVDCNGLCTTLPVPLTGVEDTSFTGVAVGISHGVALDTEGRFWAWGQNNTGAVGDGQRRAFGDPVLAPVRVNGFLERSVLKIFAEQGGDSPRTTVLLSDDTLWTFGRHGNISGTFTEGISPALVAGLVGTPIIDYCTGARFSAALDAEGTVHTIGEHTPALGLGDDGPAETRTWMAVPFPEAEPFIERIECSPQNVYALDSESGLWSWGSGTAGQLGHSYENGTTSLTVNTPTRVEGIDGEGTLTGVVDFASSQGNPSREQVTVVLASGEVATWGAWIQGNLGRAAAHQCAGSGFACTLFPRLVCAEGVMNTETCDDGEGPEYLEGVTKTASPNSGNMAIAGNTVYVWGGDDYGLNGQGTQDQDLVVPTAVPGITGRPVDAHAGVGYRLVLTDEGDIWIWGTNDSGQLGRGNQDDATCSSGASCAFSPEKLEALDDVTIVQVATGASHVAALDDTGRVWTWGANGNGELGNNAADDLGGGHRGGLSPRVVTLIPD